VVEGEKARARNPYLLVYFKAIEAKRAAMRELGFTPAARVGLPTDDSRDAYPDDKRWQWLVELGEKKSGERPLGEARLHGQGVNGLGENTTIEPRTPGHKARMGG
jgi:hypothetical protein